MSETIVRTGRVQSWIDDPTSRLPVSCTVFNCADSMEDKDGIEDSWRFVSFALRHGAGVAVHLSDLRPAGTENGKGLVSSGPVSFGKILSCLNEVLRRGGAYRSGAVVLHLDCNHPDVIEFCTAPRHELPWAKRCVNITEEWWKESTPETKEAILNGIKAGDVWLNKVRHNIRGERIRGNVCLEVYLPSRGTCLLQHIALGACEFSDIPDAFCRGMRELCELHSRTGVEESGEYLSPEIDRQVGLGVLGLANLLRRYGVSYEQFGRALEQLNDGKHVASAAWELANQLKMGIDMAADIAREYKMERAFAIAPTATCSYKSKDLDGYTNAPEIAPPIARVVDRDSGTFGVQQYDYGDVEIAQEVGWENYCRVADGIMRLLQSTGLAHGYSFNSWSDVVTYDEQFVEQWLQSPQTSLYYSLQVMADTQDKSDVYSALDDGEVDDYLQSLLKEPTCDCAE